MERRISTASRQAEAKNNKEMGIYIIIDSYSYPFLYFYCITHVHTHISIQIELAEYVHMYAVPSEVIRSKVYSCNHLEDNPANLSNTLTIIT